jgi:hypothetical protein
VPLPGRPPRRRLAPRAGRFGVTYAKKPGWVSREGAGHSPGKQDGTSEGRPEARMALAGEAVLRHFSRKKPTYGADRVESEKKYWQNLARWLAGADLTKMQSWKRNRRAGSPWHLAFCCGRGRSGRRCRFS